MNQAAGLTGAEFGGDPVGWRAPKQNRSWPLSDLEEREEGIYCDLLADGVGDPVADFTR